LGDDAQKIEALIEEEASVTDIILDAGKSPVVYFSGKEPPCNVSMIPVDKAKLTQLWITASTLSGSPEMAHTTSRTGTCMSRPLDRLSKMHHLDGSISGLTWRVAMHESVAIPAALQSSLVDRANTLLYGPPGSGKTTLLRSVAKYCSDTLRERVVVVDATGEIGGYHPTANVLGYFTRRLCVAPGGTHDHAIMDAIRNHSPTTIIVDEIVTAQDAAAVYSAAARGVRVVATTHARTTGDLIVNPIWNALIGRIKDATVTDARAKATDGRKCIRERTMPTTFTVAYGVHSETLDTDLSKTIDSML
jgi:stage III sporulation protein SpoIIIAA